MKIRLKSWKFDDPPNRRPEAPDRNFWQVGYFWPKIIDSSEISVGRPPIDDLGPPKIFQISTNRKLSFWSKSEKFSEGLNRRLGAPDRNFWRVDDFRPEMADSSEISIGGLRPKIWGVIGFSTFQTYFHPRIFLKLRKGRFSSTRGVATGNKNFFRQHWV